MLKKYLTDAIKDHHLYSLAIISHISKLFGHLSTDWLVVATFNQGCRKATLKPDDCLKGFL